MARGMEKLTFKMYFISAHLNLNSNMWLIATVLDSAVPKSRSELLKINVHASHRGTLFKC